MRRLIKDTWFTFLLFLGLFILDSCENASLVEDLSQKENSTSINNDLPQNYIRKDDKIYFGIYPQSLVQEDSDSSLIFLLNKKAGLLPTKDDLGNWEDYNYFFDDFVESYMYYQDLDLDDDGLYDYRGVYFTKYRPSFTNYSTRDNMFYKNEEYQNDYGYTLNTIYWFKYEVIEWEILHEYDNKLFIVSSLVLDSQDYYSHCGLAARIPHNGGEGYVNNYQLSSIRLWLNKDFIGTSFTKTNQEIIECVEVDNSKSSTRVGYNSYVCENTRDKIFLMSYQEILTYKTKESDRIAFATDYAKCQGIYAQPDHENACCWWLRSPENNANNVNYIGCSGRIYEESPDGIVTATSNGIRPACYMVL